VLVATTINVKLVPGTAIVLGGCWIIKIGTCAVNVALSLVIAPTTKLMLNFSGFFGMSEHGGCF
jgi:hypothetical protein